MIGFLLIFVSVLSQSEVPKNWAQVFEIRDRHEFYQNNRVVSKPVNSWQTLFAVAYYDINLNLRKDCLLYKVPGEEPGTLKVKTIASDGSCEDHIFTPGDWELKGIKALQFAVTETNLNVSITLSESKTEKWSVTFQKKPLQSQPKLFMSSAGFKGASVMLLAPESGPAAVAVENKEVADGTLCHDVTDECVEQKSSTCVDCPRGWYEVPNGCPSGPKYCGPHQCGHKGQPACRRGMRYQKARKKFECRLDSSFAYCSPGLTVECDGNKAFCR
ncbi:MAG TPA: hypothetical protein VNJ01_09940 [Bacteriovoracaceae bacterium]|nr:hypothetical protein [Bacteriovoracaceae bacterium]